MQFAGDLSLKKHKRPTPSIPTQHKLHLIAALRMVDEVCIGDDLDAPLGLVGRARWRWWHGVQEGWVVHIYEVQAGGVVHISEVQAYWNPLTTLPSCL